MHALLVVAARPNLVKIRPVLDALEARRVRCTLVHTGQHYDQSLSDVFFDELGIRRPDVNLGVGSASHAQQTAAVMSAFEPVMLEHAPDVVVVVGDVNSTIACALVAAKEGVPVAHVESGLRSRDWAMPEEVNRVLTDRLATWLLAPSADAVENLHAEGVADARVALVGNVMIDTLFTNLPRARERDVLQRLDVHGSPFGLVTLHRPSNVDDEAQLRQLLDTLAHIGRELPLLFPVHPRTRARLEHLGTIDGLQLVEPQGYLDFIALQASATVVLTDSGGIQEESTALGTPCLTLRESTERPITVSEGTNQVVGTDRADILQGWKNVKAGDVPARCPALWDGRAGARCAEAILGGGGDPAA